MKKIKKALNDPKYVIYRLLLSFGRFIPDKLYLAWMYYIRMGSKMNWKEPSTYNEICQWMKIYHRNPLYTKLADKIEAKKYVESILGPGYTFPLIAEYSTVEEIDFNALPNQFVIKTNHDSGSLCICKDKAKGDIFVGKSDNQCNLSFDEVKSFLNKSLKINYFNALREWPYKNIKRRILVEQYMQQSDGSGLKDYKFFCFNGEPKFVWMGTNYTPMYFDVYSVDWKNQNVCWGYDKAPYDVEPPLGYEQMLDIARKLSKGIPHVRIDFFNIDGHIYVGEFTFYTWSGLCPFTPKSFDVTLGKEFDLKNIQIIKE